jgi:hypothetical protein
MAYGSAKSRGLAWTINQAEYENLITRPCYYCEGVFRKSVAGIGLDRIDNSAGYEIDNVLPCCTDCNRMRGDHLTVNETQLLVKTLKFLRGLE